MRLKYFTYVKSYNILWVSKINKRSFIDLKYQTCSHSKQSYIYIYIYGHAMSP